MFRTSVDNAMAMYHEGAFTTFQVVEYCTVLSKNILKELKRQASSLVL